ncbi:MAG: DUF4157 domain-containing protein [Acidobacteriota bacterium]
MAGNKHALINDQASLNRLSSQAKAHRLSTLSHQTHPSAIIQRASIDSRSLTYQDVLQLQRTIGNQAVGRLLAEIQQSQDAQPSYSTSLETSASQPMQSTVQKMECQSGTSTGLPDDLKAGVENLSGLSMDDVRVHYNSSQPAQVQALAYTQGNDIHVGPGQEEHLPHEVWHVVQQKQGRVQPTMQLQGMGVNDDKALEQEADLMGRRAIQMNDYSSLLQQKEAAAVQQPVIEKRVVASKAPLQMMNDNNEKIADPKLKKKGSRTVKGGIVYRDDQQDEVMGTKGKKGNIHWAAIVENIDFTWDYTKKDVTEVPEGAEGIMVLTAAPKVPEGHYSEGNIIYYQDSNRHNDSTFKVLKYIGPIKYKISKES